MMKYLYETHLHTNQGSQCGKVRGQDYLRRYKDMGYTGIMVTDHFFNGNTVVDRNLPWKQWVERYCLGYEETRREGEKIGIDVFFGWEETFNGDDYLVYGLGKEWLLDHPETPRWTVLRQYEEVHRYGGCIVHAHPFRVRDYIPRIYLSPHLVDAVEAANGGNEPHFDALAMRYARSLGLPVTAGSDIHHTDQLETGPVYGVYLDEKIKTIQDYVRIIKENKIAGLRATEDRFCFQEGIDLPGQAHIRERDGRITRQSIQEMMKPGWSAG
jgi:hypothetical protein